MTIRTRLTLWHAGIMFVSLLAMSVLTYREFAPEPRSPAHRGEKREKQEEDESDLREV